MSVAPIVSSDEPEPEVAFYRGVLQALGAGGVDTLVGGAYAFAIYTGVERNTKDLDLFLRDADYDLAAQVLSGAGYETELPYPHWLGKVRHGEWFVDLIFNSGNGVTPVDEGWFERAITAEVFGMPAKIVPVEEMIWSKAFLMERERYDGADVAHLIDACADSLDWRRLAGRIGPHWRVLLSHLVLFGFIYPARRTSVPAWLMEQLLERLREELHTAPANSRLCRGTLLSREQYLHDVRARGYIDARQLPFGAMSADDIANWTDAIGERRTDIEAAVSEPAAATRSPLER